MVEFHIQSAYNREKIIMGFVNSGHTVKVVERPDPKRFLGILYYVQIDGDDLKSDQLSKEEIKDFSKSEFMAINQMKRCFSEFCKSCNGANIYNTSEGIVDVDNLFKKLNLKLR